MEDKFKLLCQWREQLSITCQEAWLEFLGLFSEGCFRYRRAVHHIATLDCLFSLAAVAKQAGFTRYSLLVFVVFSSVLLILLYFLSEPLIYYCLLYDLFLYPI